MLLRLATQAYAFALPLSATGVVICIASLMVAEVMMMISLATQASYVAEHGVAVILVPDLIRPDRGRSDPPRS
jgi:hypothetical protein